MAIEIKIDGYDSFEQIAVGGMAAVYRARKISIDKVVAIKVLFPYLASDTSFIDRFQREAKSAAKVQHENIVNVVDFGGADGCYYIVMEFYEGATIADLLKGDAPIPLDIAVAVLLDVCLGLEAAHAKGIVHRDIKPANIIYTNQGGIKIADFGLAKKSDTMTVVTQAGKVLGTPAYMSPEQAAGDSVGTQSDIFSLGVVAFEMLCRKRPFEGNSYSEVIEKIQTYEVPPLSHDNPLIRPDFERIVGRMLEKDPARRYQDIADVISDLEQAMETFDIKRDRRRLKKYIKDPAGYAEAFNDKMIARCLSQGTYYMQKGKTHLTEAMQEFKRILYLDPSNERARKHLARIMSEYGQGDSTVTIEAEGAQGSASATPGKTPKKKSRAQRPRPESSRSRVTSFWPWFNGTVTLVLITVVVLGGWWMWHRTGTPRADSAPVLSSPSRLTVTEGETIEFSLSVVDADGDSVRVYGENLPAGAELSSSGEFKWTVGYDQEGKHAIEFFADDGTEVRTASTLVEVVDKPVELSFKRPARQSTVVGKPVSLRLQAASQIGQPVAFSLHGEPDGMKLENDRITWTPSASQTGTHRVGVKGTDGVADANETVVIQVEPKSKPEPKPKATPPPPEPEYGQLSVYFLGGVGEFHLDGNKFKEQPPFTGVVVPVGQYAVSCKMFRSEDSREFLVTVKEGKNTVVEYEVGSEPVVSHETADD
jgi:serine/threonine protein kinase